MISKTISATQAGVLLLGPGALRANLLQANLSALSLDQQELVNKAKKYAMEQSIKSTLIKQAQNQSTSLPITANSATVVANNLNGSQQPQKSLHRHQALVLMCRVYVGSISFELKEETIKAAFIPFGGIKSINMSWDPITLKHKGFAFVEYELPEAAQLALEHMNGIQLGGRQIKVGRPSNMPQAAPIIQQIQEECKEKNRIYVTNVHPDLFDQELADIFDPFGKVKLCKLAMVPPTTELPQPCHRGYGFIEFETEEAIVEALTMDNFDLGGQTLHVCRATTPAEYTSPYGTLETEAAITTTAQPNNTCPPDEDIQQQLERANREQQAELENFQTTSDSIQSDLSSSIQNGHVESDSNFSNVLVLKNMITADEELDDSLQLDVHEECSKYGQVTQIVIYVEKAPSKQEDDVNNDRKNDQVKIFVKYKNDTEGSSKAKKALDGRFFGGRKISAEYYDQVLFRLGDYSQN